MPKFIPNGICLYREGQGAVIEGKSVDSRLFDRDSPTFEEDSIGWKTHEEMWAPDDLQIAEAPRRGRPPKGNA